MRLDFIAPTRGKPQNARINVWFRISPRYSALARKSFTYCALIGAPDAASIAVWGVFTRTGQVRVHCGGTLRPSGLPSQAGILAEHMAELITQMDAVWS